VIKKSKGGGYEVRSEKGKLLSRKGMSRKAAKERLNQVEYFKHRDKKSK
jgi:hypothetical protein